MSLKFITGVIYLHYCGRDELKEECLNGKVVGKEALDLNGWHSGCRVVFYVTEVFLNVL